MITPTVVFGGTIRSSASLSKLDKQPNKNGSSKIQKKTKTLPLTNSKGDIIHDNTEDEYDIISLSQLDSNNSVLNVNLRKKKYKKKKSTTTTTSTTNNRNSQEIISRNEMNITENYYAQVLSDPGVVRSMDELRILQASYHSDR
jgi:hypothetical protein